MEDKLRKQIEEARRKAAEGDIAARNWLDNWLPYCII